MLHTGQDQASLDFGCCDIHGDCGAGVTVGMRLSLERSASRECVEELGKSERVEVGEGLKVRKAQHGRKHRIKTTLFFRIRYGRRHRQRRDEAMYRRGFQRKQDSLTKGPEKAEFNRFPRDVIKRQWRG